MFWADRITEEIKKKYEAKIAAGESLIVRDEKTMSGRVHIGSLRGVIVHGVVAEILGADKARFLFELNDYDPMDGLPVYLNKEKFEPYMGRLLYEVPSPDGKAKNFAEYFGEEFRQVIEKSGLAPEIYRSSEKYLSGAYNNTIRLALENAERIREIYKRVSGSVKEGEWLPISVVCEKCRKVGTTMATSFDGSEVEYSCEPNMVKWATGCGYKGKKSPFDGNAKLPWKVEWAAKFKIFNVDIEGGGKDHSTKGGARDVANAIAREVFEYEPPFDIPYEHILIDGKKMSSSKGAGASSTEVAELLPPQLIRLLFLNKDYKQAVDFAPHGDTIPVLYDLYDKLAGVYFGGIKDDFARVFEWSHTSDQRANMRERFMLRFSQVAFLSQMPHMDLEAEVEKMKGSALTEEDKDEIEERRLYASRWLEGYAPEEYRFKLFEDEIPDMAKELSGEQKEVLKKVLEYVKSQESLDGQDLHTALHDIRKASGLEPKQFFGALYICFLNKDYGPKAGWFLSVLNKKFLEDRLDEI